MKKLLLVALIGVQGSAFAVTDFTCLSECTSQGNMYGLCKKRCSTDDSNSNTSSAFGSTTPTKSTDFNCLSDCTAKGYLYAVCKDKCSY